MNGLGVKESYPLNYHRYYTRAG